jgi:hypothetical protein
MFLKPRFHAMKLTCAVVSTCILFNNEPKKIEKQDM